MAAHRCCFIWRGDFWCACETCGQWPTEQQVAALEGVTPPPREMELADIASPMLYDYGPGWVPSWRNPPAEWFPALPPRRRVKPW